MDKLDFMILNILDENKANSSISGISRKMILEQMEIGAQNLFLRLGKLIKAGLVDNGLKEGREHTYFITKQGIERFREVLK